VARHGGGVTHPLQFVLGVLAPEFTGNKKVRCTTQPGYLVIGFPELDFCRFLGFSGGRPPC